MGPQNSITRTLYIPVEIFYREMGGCLLMASYAASRGWKVIFGGKQALFRNMSRFKTMPGVFYLKSIVPGEVHVQKEILSYGHRIVSLDVEGLVPSNGEAGVKLRYSDESIALTDILFFWGKSHYDSVYKVYPQIKNKSLISGSPIIDEILIMKEKYNRKKDKTKKKQILIGTSCGYANHICGVEFAKRMTENAHGSNVNSYEFLELENEMLLDRKIFENWKEVVPQIAEEFIDCEVVLRPHPSEDKDFWKMYLKGYKNIRIDDHGSILEEMRKSDVYIHFNSTSAVTSRILGLPTFMLLPPMDKKLLDRITYVKDISDTASSSSDLVVKIRDCFNNGEKAFQGTNINQYCENLKSKKSNSSKTIVDKLDEYYTFSSVQGNLNEQDFNEKVKVGIQKMKFLILWCAGIIVNLFKIRTKRYFPPRNPWKLSNAKQPSTGLNEIKILLSCLLNKKDVDLLILEKKDNNLFVMSKR